MFLVGFIEASLFPLSVDVPLIALGVTSPKKSLRFAAIATFGSFVGGYFGYLIGYAAFDAVGKSLLSFHGIMNKFEIILNAYRQHGMGALIVAGFIPLPYIAFTITAGFNQTIDLWTLTIGALIGRTLRFFPVGVLLFFYGVRAKVFIEKYFEIVSIVFIMIVILGIIFFRWLQ